MGFYPVVLGLAGHPVLVVGGGPVAERKVDGLLDAGARVTVVSPSLTERLETRAREGRIRWIGGACRRGDLAAVILCATRLIHHGRHDQARIGGRRQADKGGDIAVDVMAALQLVRGASLARHAVAADLRQRRRLPQCSRWSRINGTGTT